MYLILIEFAKRLANTKWAVKSTIECYLRSLMLLDDYIKNLSFWERGVEYPHTIELEDIEEFAEMQKLRGKEIRTVNNYLAWIKTFLNYCNYVWLRVLDSRRVLLAKAPDYHINALEEKDMKKLLEFMRNDTRKSEVIRMRDFWIALVLVYWWLRVSELCNLKVKERWDRIQIVGKWGSRRLVHLYDDYVKVVDLYLFLRRKIKINSDYVFVSHSNNSKWKPLDRVSVENIIKDAWKKVWLEVRPHKLRHTCATQMLEHGGEIEYISQILGHKHITTTQIYLDYSNDKLRKTQMLIPTV